MGHKLMRIDRQAEFFPVGQRKGSWLGKPNKSRSAVSMSDFQNWNQSCSHGDETRPLLHLKRTLAGRLSAAPMAAHKPANPAPSTTIRAMSADFAFR